MRATTKPDAPPATVWMHQERLLGMWFSVADECKEEGDVEYMPVANAEKLREALVEIEENSDDAQARFVARAALKEAKGE